MTFDFEYAKSVLPIILSGLPNTFLLTFFPMIAGLAGGFLIAIIRIRKVKVLSPLATVLVSFVRGVPLYVLIFLIYYTLPLQLKSFLARFGIQIYATDISAMSVALTCFTLFTSVYLSEVIRSALLSVDRGQLEAAYSIGMTERSAYFHIIIPQAAISALSNYSNLFIIIFKSTSIVFAIAVADIMAKAKTEADFGFHYTECYGILAVLYLSLCILFSFIFRRLEAYFRSRQAMYVR